MDMHVGKHIYGEGITDIFKSVGRKLFGKTAKKVAKTAATKAAEKAATNTADYAGKKAGDKIVELLSKKKIKSPSIQTEETIPEPGPSVSKLRKLTTQEVNERVNQLLLGGKLRRRNFV